jgi:Zn-finger nucleic acid-binding protein
MHLKPDMESFRCDYCRSVYVPEKNDEGVRVLDEAVGEACPICNIPLVNAAIAKDRIDYCTGCHGMLITMGTFQSLVNELPHEGGGAGTLIPPKADKDDLRRKIGCPRCHHPMDAHFYAGPGNAIIDSCETCSLIWLDRGELMRIARASDGTLPDTEPLLGDPGLDLLPDEFDQSKLVGNVRLVDSILSLIQS